MAKIIYGVAGQGFGHSSRSHLIGQHLLDQGHDVIFVASNQSLKYLGQYFGDRVKEITGLHFVYEEGLLSTRKTITSNLVQYPANHKKNLELFKEEFAPFDPELVITDFEPFSAWWAWLNKIPYISIDHEHMLTNCRLEHDKKDWFARLSANFVTRCYYAGAAAYLVLNFFKTDTRGKKTFITPPVVREQVLRQSKADGEHILFYSTDCSFRDKLMRILSGFKNHKFTVYGFDIDETDGNCQFKKTSTENFLKDLASCKGIVATAGFSLISEMLHFDKPMLLLPVLGQYEQMINAKYIQKLGLGQTSNKLDHETLGSFLKSLGQPRVVSSDVIRPDNDKFFEIFDETLSNVYKPVVMA